VPKVGFVVNPNGGNGRTLRAWKLIEAEFPDAKPYFTSKPRDGTHQAQNALRDGCHVVAAVGGDGTVNEVANALIGTEGSLAVIPVGTGNDYAKTIRSPIDPLEAAQLAYEGTPKLVDVGMAEGHRHFVNIAGVGFDAEVMIRFNHPGAFTRALPVKVRYYLSILKTFAKYKGVKATLTLDGQEQVVENLLLLAVGCAEYYGAGMHMLPGADLTDGLFDLAWGQDVRLAELNKLMALIYKGEHIGHSNVRTARCSRVVIESQPGTTFHLDGDVTGETPVTFSVSPHSLRVVCP